MCYEGSLEEMPKFPPALFVETTMCKGCGASMRLRWDRVKQVCIKGFSTVRFVTLKGG